MGSKCIDRASRGLKLGGRHGREWWGSASVTGQRRGASTERAGPKGKCLSVNTPRRLRPAGLSSDAAA
jgi:hypothetical protein